jgi:predicted nucleic-acid-binding protein
MIGLDTNVLLRFYLKDDPMHSPKARQIVNSLSSAEPGWVGLTSILEFVWVMKSKKRAGHDEIAGTLEMLLTDDVIVVEQSGVVAGAVQRFRSTKADFADCLIAESARAAGCNRTLTFDEIAARDLGMELIA